MSTPGHAARSTPKRWSTEPSPTRPRDTASPSIPRPPRKHGPPSRPVRDPYVYPGTGTLRNRFGIRDPAQLARLEAAISYARLAELIERPVAGAYDLPHLQAFHRRIFGDVYLWAGELRTVAIAKNDLFALPQHIAPYLDEVLRPLPGEGHLRGLDRDALIDRLTYYLAELNATHPFRDGNGRTQRAFIGQLAADAGYTLDWQHLDPDQNVVASQAAHRGDNAPLRALLAGLITP